MGNFKITGKPILSFNVAEELKKGNDLRTHILELRRMYPLSNIIVSGNHSRFDESSRGSTPFKSEVIKISPSNNNILICGNPWADDGYYAGSYSFYEDGKFNVCPIQFNADSKKDEDFVWVRRREVTDYEVHYNPQNKKEAAVQLLTRLEEY